MISNVENFLVVFPILKVDVNVDKISVKPWLQQMSVLMIVQRAATAAASFCFFFLFFYTERPVSRDKVKKRIFNNRKKFIEILFVKLLKLFGIRIFNLK